ncbi:MAG: HAMP domain-containing histidine kinase [Firmicutes bacterium]|uniref:histidine kinase n=1 Tax=Candidatus Scybalomonas excrementavium TaxID=2840943 RepID=A0A9D9I2P1_9FIRM|nr:HAMP domain-containing histidine kinase [Candidatus Scybalomonas excrementavium]
MKIVKKVKLMFLPAILLPLFLMMVSVVTISNFYVNTTVNADINGLEYIANPTKAVDEMTNEFFQELKKIAKEEPEKLLDSSYLNTINKKLKNRLSYLIVRQDDTIIYRGTKTEHQEVEQYLPQYGSQYMYEDGGLFISKPENFLIKQGDFITENGEQGSFFIMTCLEGLAPKFRGIIIQVILAIIGVLIFSSSLISAFMYTEFIRPVQLLKEGTDRIKEGNLDVDVEIMNRDEIGELCDSFNEMRRKLKELIDARLRYERENRELISNISHDLKTPITAIKGYVEGIMDGVADSPEKMERYIKTIYNKANDMDVLINELSIYSKIDSNVIPYNFAKIDIDMYFADCIEELSVDMEQKGIVLNYINYCKPHLLVAADAEQIKRVINNIVINAMKYNDKEKGCINIRLREEGMFVQVEIEDNGQGISENDLPHIFDRLYRADASRNSSKGGSGLGLSIAKKIIDEHGGKIWATSRPGSGTTIYFTLRKYKEDPLNE